MRTLLFLGLLLPATALAGVAPVQSAAATSTQKPEAGGVNYAAENMIKPLGFSYWAEGDGSAGLGTRLDFKFGGTQEISAVALWGGSYGNPQPDTWKNSNRIKELEFEFRAGTFGTPEKETLTFTDEMHRQVVAFAKPHKADQLKVFLRGVFDGAAFNESAISYIQFLTAGGDGYIYADSAEASSLGEGFAPFAAVDGLDDTAWCVKEGKGKGESLEIKLPKGSKIGSIEGIFGLNIGEAEWEKNARPKSVVVQVGARKETWKLSDTRDAQTLDLGGVSANTVTITIGAVQNGRIYKDACISELRFTQD